MSGEGFWSTGGAVDFVAYVEHGAVASTPRPAVPGPVLWIGTVVPDDIETNDILLNPDAVTGAITAAGVEFDPTGLTVITGTDVQAALEELDAAAGDPSPLTTKGDLYTYSTVADRLPVGADGDTLIADSTQTTGLRWGTPSGTTGRWEVVVAGVPAEAVTNEAGDDWLYAWTET